MSVVALLSRPRRVLAVVALAFGSLSLWDIFSTHSFTHALLQTAHVRVDSTRDEYTYVTCKTEVKTSPRDDIPRGYWYPAPELRETSVSTWLYWKCFSRDADPRPGEEVMLIDDGLRVENVDGWQWLLEGGLPMRELDPEEFLARAFKSRLGFVIVGDSISLQVFDAMRYLARMPTPHRPQYAILGAFAQDQSHQYLTLAPTNILRARLMDRPDLAHVPRSRFDEPFAHFWRADILLETTEELADVFTAVGTELNRNYTNRRYSPWVEDIGEYADYNGWQGELPSPMMINAGPHFDPIRFLPIRGEYVRLAYRETMRKVAEKLLGLQGVPLRVTFRSTLPAHPNCQDYLYPVPRYHPAAASATTPGIVPYTWAFFSEYNDVARGIFDQQQRDLVTMEWLDVWEMGLTRPDAHVGKEAVAHNGTLPMYDCLHWCTASVPRWIMNAWWHALGDEL